MLMGAAAEQCDSGRQEGGDAVVRMETEGEVEGRQGKGEEEKGRFPSVERSWRVPNA